MNEAQRRVAAIKAALTHEMGYGPSWRTESGKPHDYARTRHFPRFAPTGASIPGTVTIPPDCPAPVRGRCDCPPDGSWRSSGGSLWADATAHSAAVVEHNGEKVWTNDLFTELQDGTWVCLRPHRTAIERLHRKNMRRYLVMRRLLDGDGLEEAWFGLGNPVNLVNATIALCDEVDQFAAEETRAEYQYRPRIWPSPRPTPWVEKSESQQAAESAGAA